MAQTAYDVVHPVAFAGMSADSTQKQDESFFNAEATAEIPFGVFVKQGTGDFTCLNLTAVTDIVIGATVHSHSYEYGPLGGVLPKEPVNVRSKGRLWVKVEDAVTPASLVYARAVVAGAEVRGAVRGSTDATDMILIRGAHFITSAAAGGFAMVEFDMTAHRAGA